MAESNRVERGKTFIKTIANTIVEHAKKIWTNFQHFFFGNNKRKRNSFIFMSIVGGLIFLFAFTIPFALLVANIVGVAFYATVTSVGITVGTIMLTIGVCYSQNPRYKQAVKEPESVSADKSDLISSAVPTEIALEAQNKPANNGKDTSYPRFMPAPKEHPENRLKQSYEIDDASRDWMEAHSMSLNFGSRE